MNKKIYNPKSKTHNLGYLLGVAGGLLTFLPTVREFIPPETYGPLIVVVGVATVVLRNMTTAPIDDR